MLEAIWSKVDASSGWQSELGRALAKKVKSTKEFAIACDPDFKVGFELISEEEISLVSLCEQHKRGGKGKALSLPQRASSRCFSESNPFLSGLGES